MRAAGILVAALLATASAALAQGAGSPATGSLAPPPRFLGKDLVGLCEGPEGSSRQAGCLRYLQAAVSMYELAVTEAKDLVWFCAPREAPATMLRQPYLDWARDHADLLGQDAMATVRLALTDAFPCQGD